MNIFDPVLLEWAVTWMLVQVYRLGNRIAKDASAGPSVSIQRGSN